MEKDEDKWVFLDKLFVPSEKLVLADSGEVFGGSEELEHQVPKRPQEELEDKKKQQPVARFSPECIGVDCKLSRWILVYGRKQGDRLVELRILLDPLLDSF